MLRAIQPDLYQKQIRQQLDDIKHNLKLLEHVAAELSTLAGKRKNGEREVLMERGEILKIELKEKLKGMEANVGEVVAMLDLKLTIVVKQLAKLQKQQKQAPQLTQQPTLQPSPSKQQQQLKYQLSQLQQRIFQLQKRQNEHVKQISLLKERNAKLREQFNNFSFDSNQRIKELSEKLHNNTSPNLTIKKNMYGTPSKLEASYSLNGNDDFTGERKSNKITSQNNNFVKIKGGVQQGMGNIGQIDHGNVFDMSPPQKNNLLDSFTSQSSDYDVKPYGDGMPSYDQHSKSNKLMLGCFPGKQISQKTKTGSSSQNKKLKFEQNCEKSRRFQFLLNNLIDDKSQNEEHGVGNVSAQHDGLSQSGYNGNGRFTSTQNLYKQLAGCQQQSVKSPIMSHQINTVLPQQQVQQVKRYQI